MSAIEVFAIKIIDDQQSLGKCTTNNNKEKKKRKKETQTATNYGEN